MGSTASGAGGDGLSPTAGGDAPLKVGFTPLRCEKNNGELYNNLLALSPPWILNPAALNEDSGKCAVIVQFRPRNSSDKFLYRKTSRDFNGT